MQLPYPAHFKCWESTEAAPLVSLRISVASARRRGIIVQQALTRACPVGDPIMMILVPQTGRPGGSSTRADFAAVGLSLLRQPSTAKHQSPALIPRELFRNGAEAATAPRGTTEVLPFPPCCG